MTPENEILNKDIKVTIDNGTNENRAKFAKRLLAAMGSITHIKKEGTNAHFKYQFAQDSDVLHACRNALMENGISLIPSMKLAKEQLDGRTRVCVTFLLTDCETGHQEIFSWAGEATAQDDKSINKAATSAVKYALLKLFLIPTGEDPDADAGVVATSQKPSKAAASPAPSGDQLRAYVGTTLQLTQSQVKQIEAAAEAKGKKYKDVIIESFKAGESRFEGVLAHV